MNRLDRAELPAAPDGGPPVTIDPDLLDRVGFAVTVGPVGLLDQRLILRCEDPSLGSFLTAFLAPFAPVREAATVLHVVEVDGRWAAYQDGGRALWCPTVADMARSLVWLLNALALRAPSADAHVHAASVSLGGRAVVIPGRSGAGKTTLALALALAGWTYLSDEVAAIGPGGDVVHPYPRPLALDPGSWPLFPGIEARWPPDVPRLVDDVRLVLPARLGAGGAPAPAAPVAFVFPEVVAGAPTSLEPVHRADALERVVAATFNLRSAGAGGFAALAAAVRRSSCHRLVLDGVEAAPALLRSLVAGDRDSRNHPL